MADDTAKVETFWEHWRAAWPILLGTLVYMVPLFWLWQQAGYPESFGFRITAHGKVGLIDNWWYSYRLVERHHFWDLITFVYMWAAAVGIVVWGGASIWRERRKAAAESSNDHQYDQGDAR